jgi:hypothetical protein
MLNKFNINNMDLKERLLDLITMEGLNPNQCYIKTGLGVGFLDKVGKKLKRPSIDKITSAFPTWNIDYLQTGAGEKYRECTQTNEISGNKIQNSSIQQGSYINYHSDLITLFADTSKGYQETIRKRDEQIDRLIGIIEKLKYNE